MSGDEGEQAPGEATSGTIPRSVCLRLIGTQIIGRVAVASPGATPLVVPVQFVLDGETILFRSDADRELRSAVLTEHQVSFQVDQVDPIRRTGWSVLLRGAAAEVGVNDLPTVRRSRWIRIVPDSISGRRLRSDDEPGATGPPADV